MFDKFLFLAFLHSGDIAGITEQLDNLLSEYLERNQNKAFFEFQMYFDFLTENSKRNFIRKSVFHDELIQFPKLVEV